MYRVDVTAYDVVDDGVVYLDHCGSPCGVSSRDRVSLRGNLGSIGG